MIMPTTVASVELQVAQVSDKSRWTFVRVTTSDGLVGVGEATLGGREEQIRTELAPMADALIGALADARLHQRLPDARELPQAAARAALDQALWDLLARVRGLPCAHLLGGMHRHEIELYANINRRTTDRSVAGFVACAREAVGAGYGSLKIAPFDEVSITGSTADRITAARTGIDRVHAVRHAIGPDVSLMVDCHWRFDEASAADVMSALAPAALYWVECPVPESETTLDAIVRLRARANALGMRLAGNELGVGLRGFLPYLKAGAYDVMMPDVKYVGSLLEVVQMAEQFQAFGAELSPHNPNGPVCHAASLQVCAALPRKARLESQYRETDWFDALVTPALPQSSRGQVTLTDAPGLGVSLVPIPTAILHRRWLWDARGEHGGERAVVQEA